MNKKILKTLSEMKYSILAITLILVLVGAVALVGSRYVRAADDSGNGTSSVPVVPSPAKKLEGKLLYAQLNLNAGLVKLQTATTKLQADYDAIVADESMSFKDKKTQILAVSQKATQNTQTYCRYFIVFPKDFTSQYSRKFNCGTWVTDIITSYKRVYRNAKLRSVQTEAAALSLVHAQSVFVVGAYTRLTDEMTAFKTFTDGVDMQQYINAKFPPN